MRLLGMFLAEETVRTNAEEIAQVPLPSEVGMRDSMDDLKIGATT